MELRSKVSLILGLIAYGAHAATPAETAAPAKAEPETDIQTAVSAAQAEQYAVTMEPGVVQTLPLSERTTYMVGISPLVPTTILLPDVPTAFQGVGFTTQQNVAAAVFIDHSPNTNFFSVRPLMRDAVADLNLIIGERIYTFKFFLSAKPIRALTLVTPSKPRKAAPAPVVNVKRRIQILDLVRSYFVVQENYPNLVRNIEVTAPGNFVEYQGFKVIVDQVFGFEEDDTVAFRLIFSNETNKPIRYNRQNVAIRVGPNIYETSIADLSGEIPAADPGLLEFTPAVAGKVTLTQVGGKTYIPNPRTPLPPGSYVLAISSRELEKPDSVRFDVVAYDQLTPENSKAVEIDLKGHPGFKQIALTQPRAGQNFGYVAITGNPDGSRARLSLKNRFYPLVTAEKPAPEPPPVQVTAKQPEPIKPPEQIAPVPTPAPAPSPKASESQTVITTPERKTIPVSERRLYKR